MTAQDKLLKLLTDLEKVNRRILDHLKATPDEPFEALNAERDAIGEDIRTLCSDPDSQEELTKELNPRLQQQSQVILELDNELMQILDLVTHKLQSKQQRLAWALQRKSNLSNT